MKKILFAVCLLMGCITASMAQEESYKIEGHLDNSVNGQLKLVAMTEQGLLEIGDAKVENGVFEFTGRMPEVTLTYLMTNNKTTLATMMLENAHYTITMGTNELIVEGGEAQRIWREFEELTRDLQQKQLQMETQARASRNQVQLQAYRQEFQKIVKKVEAEELELIKKYNDTYVAAYVVASKLSNVEESKRRERYELLGENAKATLYGKRIALTLEKMQKVAVGAIAPDFSAPLSDGGVLSLYETKAKVKVVNFWASWNKPSRDENVNLLKIYKRFRPKGLEIISVSIDNNKQAWLRAIGQDGSDWRNVSDLKQNSEIGVLYCVTALPCTLVIDSENRIVAKDLRGKELEKKIEELLKKK